MFFRDGTEPDILSLPFFADCVPPTVFSKFGAVGWVPTLELTVHQDIRLGAITEEHNQFVLWPLNGFTAQPVCGVG